MIKNKSFYLVSFHETIQALLERSFANISRKNSTFRKKPYLLMNFQLFGAVFQCTSCVGHFKWIVLKTICMRS
jgi:hypothetical protein